RLELSVNKLEILAKIEELAALTPLEYELCRKTVAREMKIRPNALDGEIKRLRAQRQGSKAFEHSNEQVDSSTQTGAFESSNDDSNVPEIAQALLDQTDPLQTVRATLIDSGYAGDTQPAELAYLALCSRVL